MAISKMLHRNCTTHIWTVCHKLVKCYGNFRTNFSSLLFFWDKKYSFTSFSSRPRTTTVFICACFNLTNSFVLSSPQWWRVLTLDRQPDQKGISVTPEEWLDQFFFAYWVIFNKFCKVKIISCNLHLSITSANYFSKEFHFIVKIPEFEIWKDKPRRLNHS